MFRQYVSGNSTEIILAHKGKPSTGILVPENKIMGVSNTFIAMDASLESKKTAFSIRPI